ncbi:hypothetical protein [Phocoenobacter skyensis]|uniref:Uncharacterized protein n=1 Tax=Phocoenobacter skyensis TaxID=97481 RepID=A0ABT9JI94_9PAST|nr:hypothetical protein [Pasteurella skyensis]MDP8078397.1 hypothetical protein [Pasteurella skyensis]MDP8084511.1 hypothetical protein [Pasteurella skyensis]
MLKINLEDMFAKIPELENKSNRFSADLEALSFFKVLEHALEDYYLALRSEDDKCKDKLLEAMDNLNYIRAVYIEHLNTQYKSINHSIFECSINTRNFKIIGGK